MLTCRLVLNLRRVPREQHHDAASRGAEVRQQWSTMPQMQFSTGPFLGNIGAPLRDYRDDLDAESSEEEME